MDVYFSNLTKASDFLSPLYTAFAPKLMDTSSGGGGSGGGVVGDGVGSSAADNITYGLLFLSPPILVYYILQFTFILVFPS